MAAKVRENSMRFLHDHCGIGQAGADPFGIAQFIAENSFPLSRSGAVVKHRPKRADTPRPTPPNDLIIDYIELAAQLLIDPESTLVRLETEAIDVQRALAALPERDTGRQHLQRVWDFAQSTYPQTSAD